MLYHVEKKSVRCNECGKLTWHSQQLLSTTGVLLCVLLVPVTLGFSLLFLLAKSRKHDHWTCDWCSDGDTPDSRYGLSESEIIQDQAGPSRKVANRTKKQRAPKEVNTRPSIDHLPPKTIFGELIPPLKKEYKPTAPPRGSFAPDRQKRPPAGCTPREYWDWHDTLYLGGSSRSTEWRARAREAKERDGWRCIEPDCGSTDYLEVDHIIALSKNGSNELDNLQTLCHSCHEKKSGRQFPDISSQS